MKAILIVTTRKDTLRSEIVGSTLENITVAKDFVETQRQLENKTLNSIPVGLIPGGKSVSYPSVLHAILDGWELMSPPSEVGEEYEWWLVKTERPSNNSLNRGRDDRYGRQF